MTSCPITTLKSVEYADAIPYLNNTLYTVKPFKDRYQKERYLVTSKDAENSLPLVSTAVEGGNPCMKPGQRNEEGPTLALHPLELIEPPC